MGKFDKDSYLEIREKPGRSKIREIHRNVPRDPVQGITGCVKNKEEDQVNMVESGTDTLKK